ERRGGGPCAPFPAESLPAAHPTARIESGAAGWGADSGRDGERVGPRLHPEGRIACRVGRGEPWHHTLCAFCGSRPDEVPFAAAPSGPHLRAETIACHTSSLARSITPS